MNIFNISRICIFCFALFAFLGACVGGYFVTNYTTYYTAVYMPYAELRASFHAEAAQELRNPGKLVIFGDYVFLNEKDKGIHIIDNKNPRSPQPITFLHIPGNYDLAVKDGYLYADSFIDIIVIDIRDPFDSDSVSLVTRLENVIPYNPQRNIGELYYNNHAGKFYHINEIDHTQGVVVDWETEVKYSKQWVPHGAKFSPPASESGTGSAGSMTRFMIKNDYLYTVDESGLKVFSLKKPQQPQFLTSQKVDQGRSLIETIFAYNHYLFLGSQIGMYIYSIGQTPGNPEFVASLTHTWSRDPVIVHDDLAYVTLLMGEIQIVDISNIREPKLIKRYNCSGPSGLSIDMPYLFIATRTRMLVYDVTDPAAIKLLAAMKYPAGAGYEVIADNKHLFVVTTEGLFQYDYSDIDNIKLLSSLQIMHKHR